MMLIASSFVACSSDDDDSTATTGTTLVIEVSEKPMASTVESRRIDTRSAVYTINNLNNLHLSDNRTTTDEEISNYTIIKSGSTWSVDGYTWPSMDKVTFFSWNTSQPLHYDSGYYIYHTVDENASSQTDLLVATTTVPENSSSIHLSYDHACAAVNFTISKTEKLSGCNVIVKEVKLHNIIDQGYYYFNRENPWVHRNHKTNYTIRSTSGETISTTPTPLMAENDYLFMIPQSLTAWDKSSELKDCYFSIKCTINGTVNAGTDQAKSINFVDGTAYIPFAPAWEAGTMYTVDILLGTALRDGNGNKIF